MAIQRLKKLKTNTVKADIERKESGRFRLNILLQILPVIAAFWATYIAFDALKLQRQQAIEASKQDSLRSIQDSIKNAKFIEMSQQQIEALRQQADVLRRSANIEEKSKRPYLDAIQFGFHKIDEKNNRVLMFKVVNNGIRPAMLKGIRFATFYSRYEKRDGEHLKVNKLLVNDEAVIYTYAPKKNNEIATWTEDEIKKMDTFYAGASFEYYDPLNKKLRNTEPIFYKWVAITGLIKTVKDGDSSFFAFAPVGTEKEINALSEAFEKTFNSIKHE